MTINMIRRCKRLIAQPNYYRDRALQMGEIFGSWVAELSLSNPGEATYYKALINRARHVRKLEWYVRKILANKQTEPK